MDEVMNDTPIEQTETETQEQQNAETTESSEESTTDENTTESAESEEQQADDFSLDIKYNKEHISLNREDAIKYAQMGKKLEALDPTLKELEYLAASDGKSLKEFVKQTIEMIEAEKEQAFRDKADGDEEIFQALLEKDKADRGKAYEKMLEAQKAQEEQAEQDEIKTLSSEFNTLKKEVPEFQDKSFENVPEKVLEIRNKNGISLYDAYLRYQFENAKLSQKEADNQRSNADSSTGAVKPDNSAGATPNWEKELLKGIWG
ncbi:MAG: hypothetical protein ACI39F_03535 [Acutalibacteraceae bacterium]